MNDIAAEGLPEPATIDALIEARHGDPFAVLGRHPVAGGFAIRVLRPDARTVQVIDPGTGAVVTTLRRIHDAGLFTGTVPTDAPYRLRVETHAGVVDEAEDPYSFGPILGDLDLYLLAEGRHHDFARMMGAHVDTIGGVPGVRFSVWAPNARRVSVVGEFNAWDGRRHPMRLRQSGGIWELFIPRLTAGAIYKYELLDPNGARLPLKADPCAWTAEAPPRTASIVADTGRSRWTDHEWMAGRAARQSASSPISIYEVHAPSWLPIAQDDRSGWDMLAERLVPYVAGMGFTHIELMPVAEHPFGGSWGYQPLGQFAPTARMGSPDAFARFVDQCHRADIGVLVDWVPAHFPTDAHGLARFDGTALYEHADPREGFHRDWNTLIYNHGRNEVRGFLIGSALHFLEHFHIDGLRVDAVASMLYRDYSRNAGEWIPNKFGGRENLETVAFLQDLSRVVGQRCPGAVLIAEESTAWPGVTRPADDGGLGFDFKWNMGWMHDTLAYVEEQPIYRRWHHDQITFGLVYAFSEKFVLPLSHDEVVYGKHSILGKMPGDDWQRFANLRAYYGLMWTHPGKKLLFMGSEFGQEREWNHDTGLDFFLLDQPRHSGVQKLLRDANALYRALPALHVLDANGAGFRWVVIDDSDQSVFAWLRLGHQGDAPALVVCNFTPVPRYAYRVGVPVKGRWREVLNTDADIYGGSNMGNAGSAMADETESHGLPASLLLTLPPLATIVLTPDRE